MLHKGDTVEVRGLHDTTLFYGTVAVDNDNFMTTYGHPGYVIHAQKSPYPVLKNKYYRIYTAGPIPVAIKL